MVAGLLPLDRAHEAGEDVVGGKAARLARAASAGLPVLPGVVVTAPCSRPAVRAAVEALQLRGSGAARLAAMRTELEDDLLDDLRREIATFDGPAIVRSSSAGEAGSAWSGAFSSFEDVGPDELSTAVRGVWASAFTVHALERFEVTDTDPEDFSIAVLVQPQLKPDCGGTARCGPNGSVRVNVTTGPLVDLVGGWDAGQTAVVTANGVVQGEAAEELVGREALLAAADLARRVQAELDDDVIEWARVDGDVHLLQTVRSRAPGSHDAGPLVVDEALDDPVARRLAVAAALCSGPLGEDLVLPWAAATEVALPEEVTPSEDPLGDLVHARELARRLTGEAWQRRGTQASHEVAEVLQQLLEGETARALGRLRGLRPVDAEAARQVVALVAGVGAAMVRSTALRTADQVWRCAADDLIEALRVGRPPRPPRQGPGRWEPFVHAAVTASPRASTTGVPVVEGIGAGRLVGVRDPHDPPPVASRQIIVARQPLPALAPLLWSAAGLVCEAGNPGAHLLEVAHSLGVPAVVGVDLDTIGVSVDRLTSGDPIVGALDGERGLLSIA